MEIKYNRSYIPKGKKYTAGEIAVMHGYAMEITELRPKLAEGRLAPGEICMMLFGLTKEEYGWKDSDPKALDVLGEKLRKEQPADRLIAVQVRDLKGTPVKRAIKLQTAASIDGGAFAKTLKTAAAVTGPLDAELTACRDLQRLCADKDAPEGVKADWRSARKLLGEKLAGLDVIYAAYDASIGGRFPCIDFGGRIDVFTVRERAEQMKALVDRVNGGVEIWTIREFSGNDVEGFFRTCERLGTPELQIDNGFAAAKLSLSDFRPEQKQENGELRRFILCEMEYGLRWNRLKAADAPEKIQRGALESMLTFRNFTQRCAGNAILYAVCDAPHAGHGSLCTPAAYAKLNGKAGLRITGGEKAVMLGRRDTSDKYLAAFSTEIQAIAFAEKANMNARPVAMTFDDLARCSGAAAGILIDPEGLAYRLLKGDYDKVRDLRGRAPLAVRIQPPEEAAPTAEPKDSAPATESDDVNRRDFSLPDPDAFDAPAKETGTETETAEIPAAESEGAEAESSGAQNEAGNKGFFKRLFGK